MELQYGRSLPVRFGSCWRVVAFLGVIVCLVLGARLPAYAQNPCDPPVLNPIVCENSKPGNPPGEWDITGAGDASIQGFATEISVNKGETVRFKIGTDATDYRLDIYRMGYYGGDGARFIATVEPAVTLPQVQPVCLTDEASGLIDCGNWGESASWNVPADATSGIYFAKLVRQDGVAGASHIVFVVRDDDGGAEVLFQTSDTTWQAYNSYGGHSLYIGAPGANPGRAYKVSYNRPFNTREVTPEDWVFYAEYPMVRWLEANGYDVSYFTGVDSDRRGAEILEHQVLLSVGHDEYWSAGQRAHVEAARGAGVHLAFLSGNEVFWKTRWESSIDGLATPYRTLVTYKETHANDKIDPLPNVWTGTWRDPRFSPPADGGQPENALTGTIFTVNCCAFAAIEVPAAAGKMRFWRNTSVATLEPDQTAVLVDGTIGYEWDEDLDNGSRPAGLIRLSETRLDVPSYLLDHGSSYGLGTATHRLTLYRHSSGALVFGAGTTQWPWGLDEKHDGHALFTGVTIPDVRMQQATVNLLADMGIQPNTLQAGLVPASASTDTTLPASTITSPASGSPVQAQIGSHVTISGIATDTGGGVVGAVEISVDGGATWHPATGRETWSYSWQPSAFGEATLMSRAVDDSGNIENPPHSIVVFVEPKVCPCSIWDDTAVPTVAMDPDTQAIEVGVRVRANVDGYITGIRFYKGAENNGPHVGHLWSNNGTLLASVSFTDETATGWQQVALPTAVTVTANTTYVVSYYAPAGRYAFDEGYFAQSFVNAPLRAPANGEDGPNGVYKPGASGFPTQTFNASNYWVDVVFDTNPPPPDTTPPTVSNVSYPDGTTEVNPGANVSATFDEFMDAATINTNTVQLRDPSGNLVATSVSYDAATRTVTLNPTATLASLTTYRVTIKGGANGVKDLSGNPLSTDVTWSFTTGTPPECPCSLWDNETVPTLAADPDTQAIEVGVKFQAEVDGYITGVRFYKGPENTSPHVGNLWTNDGTLLASVAFTNETAMGWQQVDLPAPVAITANTTYVVSYRTTGHYALDEPYFSEEYTNPPLRALADNAAGGNGVYTFGVGFPTGTFNASNYWVDVVFNTVIPPDTAPPTIGSVSPAHGSIGVGHGTPVTVTFWEPMDATTINTSSFALRDNAEALVTTVVSYDATTRTATLTPNQPLATLSTYTATVKGGDPSGVKDVAGNALAADYSWSFTTIGVPPDQGPGGPILVITTDAFGDYGNYYAEILRTEGLNAFAIRDISSVSAADLTAYDVIILDSMPLIPAQVTMLSDWVEAGGNLIAIRPDKQLAGLLGLIDASSTLSNGYLLVHTSAGPGAGIVGQTIQFHGLADLYNLGDASPVATLYTGATTATSSPAVTLRSVGTQGGQAAAFMYDLALSIIDMRQGNVAWRGQERDGLAPIRSDDMFFGAASDDPQPDWIDLDKVAIPQADEQQRLLANLILNMNLDKKPLPRFWYFPRGLKAVVVMTGDDHANGGTAGRFDQYIANSPPNCSVEKWECIRGTSYMYHNSPMTDTQAAAYTTEGFEVALHVNTGCSDWTPASLEAFYSNQLNAFTANYPSIPPPSTNRTHCIVWSDYVTQAKVELAHGIRLDTTYYYFPPSWVLDRPGFFTGSGMPMRFVDLDGTMIDVYQAATQMTDESGQTYPLTVDTLLDRALGPEGYYGAFTTNLHTDFATLSESDAVVASAQARGVPVVSARQMLVWLDGRNNSSFGSISWNVDTLNFTISVGTGANDLEVILPTTSASGTLANITRDANPVFYTINVIKGIEYAAFPALAGAYQAMYTSGPDTTPPTVVNVSPLNGATAVATDTTVSAAFSEVMGAGTISASTFELRDAANNLVPAAVGYTAALRTATLSPNSPLANGTTYTATVKGGVTGVKDAAGNALVSDMSWSFTTQASTQCPCSLWNAAATPTTAATADAQAVEVGMKFRVDVDGYISALRFYKGEGNNGPHVGHLWTSTGTLLAAATFTNETATGWQQVTLPTVMAVTADTTYVVSYHAPEGYYASTAAYFASAFVNPPLRALANGVEGGNGVYKYGASGFPTQTFNASNYWVDVVFTTSPPPPDTTPPTVSGTSPANGAIDVPTDAAVHATFSEAMDAATIDTSRFELRDAAGAPVAAAVSYSTGTGAATLTPSSPLAGETTYTATIKGGPAGVNDVAGNALAADFSWSFTTQPPLQCPCSLWADATIPLVEAASDTSAVELGMRFRAEVDGFITGLRFYKGPGNNGQHIGNLWTSGGILLASVTFTNETATGWQQMNFSSPVAIAANATYVVSYHTPSGLYAFDPQYFNVAYTNSPLRALADGEEGGNGVYQYGTSGFPANTFNAANYWVDVIFNTVVP